MTAYGSQAMCARLARVMMRRPGPSLLAADPATWHYGPTFDAGKAVEQYAALATLVEESGAEILWMEDTGDGLADAMFTQDPSFVTDRGAVILRMGKTLRLGEGDLHEAAYRRAGIPVLGRLQAPGTVESGDCVWLDAKTLVIGRGIRSNQAGIDQVQEILRPLGVTISELQNTARFRLAGAVPAKVLADMLDFSVATFENYARLSGSTRGDYPALRDTTYRRSS